MIGSAFEELSFVLGFGGSVSMISRRIASSPTCSNCSSVNGGCAGEEFVHQDAN